MNQLLFITAETGRICFRYISPGNVTEVNCSVGAVIWRLGWQIRDGCPVSAYSARMQLRPPRRLRLTAKHRSAKDSVTPGRSGRLRESDPRAGLRQQRKPHAFRDFDYGCPVRYASPLAPISQLLLPDRQTPLVAGQSNRS